MIQSERSTIMKTIIQVHSIVFTVVSLSVYGWSRKFDFRQVLGAVLGTLIRKHVAISLLSFLAMEQGHLSCSYSFATSANGQALFVKHLKIDIKIWMSIEWISYFVFVESLTFCHHNQEWIIDDSLWGYTMRH